MLFRSVFVYDSYRNDGYYTISTVSAATMTLATGSTVVDELSGRSVVISVVKWPLEVKRTAALMIAWDYDVRPKRSAGIQSHSLGPFSETYTQGGENGYPLDLLASLPLPIARVL